MFRYIVSALSQLHRGVLICGGFALFMAFGALLLMLPFSTTGNAEVSFVDALFMSVSVVSVTGMSMFDVRTDFTIFGQLVILFLMQVGGLGIMTIMAMVGISTGRKIRLQERLLIRDSFNLQTPSGMVMLVRKIIFMTLLVEFISGTLLAVYFYFKFGPMGIYLGYWHAVSAFTNCGLDIMGANAGFAKMAADPFVSTVIVVTMFLGGVGFMAADDFLRHRSWSGLSLNSKLIFLMEAILIPLGTIIFYNLEGNNPAATRAIKAFVLRVAKYIGAYAAELNGADAICFTAGIGENSPVIRELICSPYLEHLGVELDKEANNIRGKERIVSTPSAKTKVLVIPTNEELEIARHTLAIVKGK